MNYKRINQLSKCGPSARPILNCLLLDKSGDWQVFWSGSMAWPKRPRVGVLLHLCTFRVEAEPVQSHRDLSYNSLVVLAAPQQANYLSGSSIRGYHLPHISYLINHLSCGSSFVIFVSNPALYQPPLCSFLYCRHSLSFDSFSA